MTYLTIERKQPKVIEVTLDRPHKHNAFDEKLIAELTDTLQEVKRDASCQVLVLSAKGKSFSAGADLHWMKRMINYTADENLKDAEALANLLLTLKQLPQVTLAKIQGSAFGGGIGLIACCDLAISIDTASFCFSEVKLGLIPAVISPFVLAAIGVRQTNRYFLTAEPFSAEKALQMGLIHELATGDGLEERCEEMVNQLLLNSPNAMHAAKTLVQEITTAPINENLLGEMAVRIAKLRTSPEGQAGLKAFLEKLTPHWIQEQD